MGRDVSRDQSGDQAAWRDLVARLELPSAIDPANAPWPDRENLEPTAPGAPTTGAAAADPDAPTARQVPGTQPQRQGGSDQADAPDETRDRGSSAQDAPANRGRVIRPSGFLRFADPLGGQPRPDAPDAPDGLRDRSQWPDGQEHSRAYPDEVFLNSDDQDDLFEGEGYVPPYVPPQPKLDPVARAAWTALFGGPGYLFIATTLGWQVPGWAELAAIAAFVAGFVILVCRLGDGPSRRDGPDQGAVV